MTTLIVGSWYRVPADKNFNTNGALYKVMTTGHALFYLGQLRDEYQFGVWRIGEVPDGLDVDVFLTQREVATLLPFEFKSAQ